MADNILKRIIEIVVKSEGANDQIKATTGALNDLDESQTKVTQSTSILSKEQDTLTGSVSKNGGAMGLLNAATGGVAQTVKDAGEATALFAKQSALANIVIGQSTGAMKIFRIALASTGVGLLVLALVSLYQNFDKVKDAVLNLVPGLKIVGDFIMSIVNTVTDFVGLTSDLTRELDKLGEQADKSLKKNKDALDEFGDTFDEYTKRKITAVDEMNNKIAALRDRDDLDEREKLDKIAKYREKAQRDIDAADDDRQKAKDKKAEEAQKKIDDANTKAQAKRDAAANKEKAAAQKLLDEANAINEKAVEATKNRYQTEEEALTEKYMNEKALLEAQGIDTINLEIEYWNKINEIRLKQQETEEQNRINAANKKAEEEKIAADKEVKIEQEKADQKQAIQDAQLQAANSLVGFLKGVAGKNKALQKTAIVAESALGIGKMVIANNTANIGALATPQAIATSGAAAAPVIAFNNISTALGIASTVLATAKALSAVGDGGGAPSGGGNSPVTPSPPSTPTANLNTIRTNPTNQLASSINSSKSVPTQAYVVSSTMTNQQELDRNRNTTATFLGG